MNTFCEEKLLSALEQNGIYMDNRNNNDEVLTIDSISFVTLIVDLEEMFSISFEDEDFKRMTANDGITVRLLETIIKQKVPTTDSI